MSTIKEEFNESKLCVRFIPGAPEEIGNRKINGERREPFQSVMRAFFEQWVNECQESVGCGLRYRRHIQKFAELLPDARFIGIDNSKDILENTRRISKSNAAFVHGDASRLPFEDGSFDFVYTRLVLMHNPNPEFIIREMKRVCRPGGTIVSVEIDDETVVFYPFANEFSVLIRAQIEYARQKGTDRIMGRKLFSIYKSVGMEEVKVITQTSDYEGAYEDVPFSLRLALGSDEARHLVDAGLITENERVDYVQKVKVFCEDPHRYYSGSFMYCVGKNEKR